MTDSDLERRRPIIGYTLGDQAGIGPEIVKKAMETGLLHPWPQYRLIGKRLRCRPGKPTDETARAAFEHLELAAEGLRTGAYDAVVTAPVCKAALHRVGFTFPGQTEFFASRLGVEDYAMCLKGDNLTVALATTHVALKDVPALLKKEELVRIGLLLCRFLKRIGIKEPRIAVAGLNPHNGENGAFGDEESRIIAPAVLELNQRGGWARFTGPCVPDCVYREAAENVYDAVLAPYHDQALVPLKLLDFDTAVNVTIGLPRLRVSPDHGTAFDIAGQGIADASSMTRAFQLAAKRVLQAAAYPDI